MLYSLLDASFYFSLSGLGVCVCVCPCVQASFCCVLEDYVTLYLFMSFVLSLSLFPSLFGFPVLLLCSVVLLNIQLCA